MALELSHDYEPTPLLEANAACHLVQPPPATTNDGWTVDYAMKKIDEMQ